MKKSNAVIIAVLIFLSYFIIGEMAYAENVALSGIASQSSIYPFSDGYFVASKAIDGDRNGDYLHGSITHTNQDVTGNPVSGLVDWWEVKLNGKYPISQINVFNRTDRVPERLIPSRITLFDGANIVFTKDITIFTSDITGPNISGMIFKLSGQVGDRIRIQLLHQDYLSLAEVEVYSGASSTNLIDATYGNGAGSFELGNFINGGADGASSGGGGYMGLAAGSTVITGWTVGPGNGGIDWITSPTYAADSGLHSVDLQHMTNSSIASVIPTVAGSVYRLSFGAAAVTSYRNNTGVVTAGSLVNQPFAAAFSASIASQKFTPFTFLFTATGATTEIRFTGTGTNTLYGPVIDSVSVVPSAEYFGNTLKTSSSYELTLEQNTIKTESIQLINPGTVARTANLAIVNPNSGMTVTVVESNPISIAPGATKSLSLTIDDGSLPVGSYDGLLLKISVDDGSTLYSNIKVNVVAQGTANLPDLTLGAADIGFSVTKAGDPVTLTATIRNQGKLPAANVLVRFYEFGALLGETIIPQVAANGNTSTSIVVPMDSTGDHLVRVVIDPLGTIPEFNETNNEASQVIQPGGPAIATEGNILVTGSLPTTVYSNSLFTLSGRAVYDLMVQGVRNTDYVVKGGAVQITVTGDGGAEWVYGNVHTDINGNLSKSLQAPTIPGIYHILMTVSDKTFIGKRELVFNVIAHPPVEPAPPVPPIISGIGHWTFLTDVWSWTWTTPPSPNEPALPQSDMRVFSENIYFSKNHPALDDEITIFAELRYWATRSDLFAENVPVNIYVTEPGLPRLKVGSTSIDKMSVGSPDFGSRYVYATWKNRAESIYLVEVEIDPGYVEENKLNNAATRAIIVGQLKSQQGAISGQVFDSWGNGIGNVILELTEANGTSLGSTSTDPAGFYLVNNVPLGEMKVHVVTPGGYQTVTSTKTTVVTDSSVSAVDFLLTQNLAPPTDTIPPVLNLSPDITKEATGLNGASVTYNASATDAVDGIIIPSCTPASGSIFALGTISVSCSATDKAGNTASGSFSVTVHDTTPPNLVCPLGVTVVQGQQPNLGSPVVSDIVDSGPKLVNNAPANYPVGVTPVIWTATDFTGNSASCTQQITVTPLQVNKPPVANAGKDQMVKPGSLVKLIGSGSDPDNGPLPLTFTWIQITGAKVNLQGALTARPTFIAPNKGSYTFHLVVNDGAANSAPSEVKITVSTSGGDEHDDKNHHNYNHNHKRDDLHKSDDEHKSEHHDAM